MAHELMQTGILKECTVCNPHNHRPFKERVERSKSLQVKQTVVQLVSCVWTSASTTAKHKLLHTFLKGCFSVLCVWPFFEYPNHLPSAGGHLLHGMHNNYWWQVTSCHQVLSFVHTFVLTPILRASHTILGLLRCFELSWEHDFCFPMDIADSYSSMQCNIFTPPHIFHYLRKHYIPYCCYVRVWEREKERSS